MISITRKLRPSFFIFTAVPSQLRRRHRSTLNRCQWVQLNLPVGLKYISQDHCRGMEISKSIKRTGNFALIALRADFTA